MLVLKRYLVSLSWLFLELPVKISLSVYHLLPLHFLSSCSVKASVPLIILSVSKVKVKSLSHVRLFVIPWTAVHQALPSMGFSKQEYWSGLPFPRYKRLPLSRIICKDNVHWKLTKNPPWTLPATALVSGCLHTPLQSSLLTPLNCIWFLKSEFFRALD